MKKYKYLSIYTVIIAVIIVMSINVYAGNIKIKDITINDEYSKRIGALTYLNGEPMDVQYKETRINNESNKENHVYTDKSKNQYIFNEYGNMIGFISVVNQNNLDTINSIKISADDRRHICEDFLSQQIGSILGYKYFGETYVDKQGYYELLYYKMINGIKTSDFIFIDISPTGDIVAFAAPNINCFSEIKVPEFSVDDYSENIFDILNQKYPNMISYDIKDAILQKNLNSIDLVVYIEVSLSDTNKSYKQGDNVTVTII